MELSEQITIHPSKPKPWYWENTNLLAPSSPYILALTMWIFWKPQPAWDRSHHWWQTFLTCTRWLSKIFILQKMDALRRISYLPELVLDEIYFKTIIPSVTYTISMWRNCSQSLLHSLDHIHARACRIINHLPSKLDDSICLSKCNWLTFDYLYKKRILLKMYQVWTESAPRPIQ